MQAKPQSGDECPECGHHYIIVNSRREDIIVNSRREGIKRVRYVGCRQCGHRPENNVSVVPLDVAPGRIRFAARPC